jgi:uncharacterized ferritin-like protein (DUF455 family)
MRSDSCAFLLVCAIVQDGRAYPTLSASAAASPAIHILHTLAHIELTAVDIYWDSICRVYAHLNFPAGISAADFSRPGAPASALDAPSSALPISSSCVNPAACLPAAFFDDFISVLADETRHFGMVRARLRALGSDYGALPVHAGLWDIGAMTRASLAARLALVPLVQEARGLDSGPRLVQRLRSAGDRESAAIVAQIVDEEERHVAVGMRWFAYLTATFPPHANSHPEQQCHAKTQRGESSAAEFFSRIQPPLPTHLPFDVPLSPLTDSATLPGGLTSSSSSSVSNPSSVSTPSSSSSPSPFDITATTVASFHAHVRRHLPTGLVPPFNHAARERARMPRSLYEPLAMVMTPPASASASAASATATTTASVNTSPTSNVAAAADAVSTGRKRRRRNSKNRDSKEIDSSGSSSLAAASPLPSAASSSPLVPSAPTLTSVHRSSSLVGGSGVRHFASLSSKLVSPYAKKAAAKPQHLPLDALLPLSLTTGTESQATGARTRSGGDPRTNQVNRVGATTSTRTVGDTDSASVTNVSGSGASAADAHAEVQAPPPRELFRFSILLHDASSSPSSLSSATGATSVAASSAASVYPSALSTLPRFAAAPSAPIAAGTAVGASSPGTRVLLLPPAAPYYVEDTLLRSRLLAMHGDRCSQRWLRLARLLLTPETLTALRRLRVAIAGVRRESEDRSESENDSESGVKTTAGNESGNHSQSGVKMAAANGDADDISATETGGDSVATSDSAVGSARSTASNAATLSSRKLLRFADSSAPPFSATCSSSAAPSSSSPSLHRPIAVFACEDMVPPPLAEFTPHFRFVSLRPSATAKESGSLTGTGTADAMLSSDSSRSASFQQIVDNHPLGNEDGGSGDLAAIVFGTSQQENDYLHSTPPFRPVAAATRKTSAAGTTGNISDPNSSTAGTASSPSSLLHSNHSGNSMPPLRILDTSVSLARVCALLRSNWLASGAVRSTAPSSSTADDAAEVSSSLASSTVPPLEPLDESFLPPVFDYTLPAVAAFQASVLRYVLCSSLNAPVSLRDAN